MPTTATLLVNALSPAHRALLYTALNAFEVLHQECLEDVEAMDYNPHLKLRLAIAHQYSIDNTALLKKQLFAECFIDDLRLEKHINRELKLSKDFVTP